MIDLALFQQIVNNQRSS